MLRKTFTCENESLIMVPKSEAGGTTCSRQDCIYKMCSEFETKKIRFDNFNSSYKFTFDLSNVWADDTTNGDCESKNILSSKDSK
jgi:hypothetical protein